MKSIDDAIKHCKEKAEELERRAEEVAMNDAEGVYQPQVARCRDCASEHRQLAEWLRELKAYKEARKEITRKMNSGQWSEGVVYGLDKAVRIMEKHLREVNADEEGSESE